LAIAVESPFNVEVPPLSIARSSAICASMRSFCDSKPSMAVAMISGLRVVFPYGRSVWAGERIDAHPDSIGWIVKGAVGRGDLEAMAYASHSPRGLVLRPRPL
jgi:hypothetical protein